MKYTKYSMCIIGSGIAGLYLALKVASQKHLKDGILIITKSRLNECNSRLAQGGIVGVLPELNRQDSVSSHISDTIKAGCGLSDFNVVKFISQNSGAVIQDLINIGVEFDRTKDNKLCFGLEGAHSVPRILHAGGDATGKCIEEKLCEKVVQSDEIEIYEHSMAVELLVDKNKDCKGVLVYNNDTDSYEAVYSNAVIIASGGVGQIYKYTTNPEVATGDGIAIAHHAGAEVKNMEFMQFHPTALAIDKGANMPLMSEALRGEGAKLVDYHGKNFAKKYDERGELAPRDIVSRAIFTEIVNSASDCVYLDVSYIDKDKFEKRFPSISQICIENNINLRDGLIPVTPAAHYYMGGVATKINGETSINNLYAIGEAACTGLHGANRLASNSLLECVVCAYELANTLSFKNLNAPKNFDENVKQTLDMYENDSQTDIREDVDFKALREKLKNTMWQNAGIIRTEEKLNLALNDIEQIKELFKNSRVCYCKEEYELRNSVEVAELLVKAAIERKSSVGAHFRSDYIALQYDDDKNLITLEDTVNGETADNGEIFVK